VKPNSGRLYFPIRQHRRCSGFYQFGTTFASHQKHQPGRRYYSSEQGFFGAACILSVKALWELFRFGQMEYRFVNEGEDGRKRKAPYSACDQCKKRKVSAIFP